MVTKAVVIDLGRSGLLNPDKEFPLTADETLE